jgi:prepilin-type N-terminal cleavage/methylation domain-containing protein
MKKHTIKGFTLIELLMVIAIIGILAGILIPTVGAVKKQANIAASKAQLSNYITALNMFKGEYSYYPYSGVVVVNSASPDFIKTLSGSENVGGNRRQIAFHSFAESEFYYDQVADTVSDTTLADRFNNTNLYLFVDEDGNGEITPTPGAEATSGVSTPGTLRASVTAWVEEDADENPGYSLWD